MDEDEAGDSGCPLAAEQTDTRRCLGQNDVAGAVSSGRTDGLGVATMAYKHRQATVA